MECLIKALVVGAATAVGGPIAGAVAACLLRGDGDSGDSGGCDG
jgi:hypothetical protein